jgi:hypothetical protein
MGRTVVDPVTFSFPAIWEGVAAVVTAVGVVGAGDPGMVVWPGTAVVDTGVAAVVGTGFCSGVPVHPLAKIPSRRSPARIRGIERYHVFICHRIRNR